MAQRLEAPAGAAIQHGPALQATQPRQGMPAYQAAPPAPAALPGQAPGAAPGQAPAGPTPPTVGMLPGPAAGPAVQPGQHARTYPGGTRGRAPGGPAGPHEAGYHQPQSPGQPGAGKPGPYVPHQGPLSGQPAAPGDLAPQSSAAALADAVEAAHGEGFSFGQAVARDSPALWLEAVLARKPRMPSDLEARLLQDSSLPIDSLLHDEVRNALRRGFWDALERVRR
jgi:hypothetical protein